MKSNLLFPTLGRTLSLPWVYAGTLALSALFGSSAAYAVAPPALTNIGNTATASFTDSHGSPALVTSNPVITVVQQVGNFALDGQVNPQVILTNTKTVTAGGTVYLPHVLTNTGNGSDKFNISAVSLAGLFSKIEIYQDDGTGNPTGAALCSVGAGKNCAAASPVTIAGSNGAYKFVVAYTIPASATGSALPFESGTVTAAPVDPSPLYTIASVSVRDAVNLTTGAAFTMTKSIAVPGVSPPSGSWPLPVTGGPASTSNACSTVWGAGLSSSATCKYTVYTLTFSNIGVATGRFALADTLPAGLTYVTGSAVWSNAPGTALTELATGDPAGIDFQYSAGKLTAVVTAIQQGFTQTLSFVVLVNNTAASGNGLTTNIAFYNPGDAGTATSTNPGNLPSYTGTTPYVVYGSYRVAVGSASSTGSSALDVSPGTPNATTADTTTVAGAVAGSIVKFDQRIYNLGDAVDTFNLSMTTGSFPAGTTFLILGADGNTPLQDTGVADGVVDTGPIAPGAQATVVVAAFLPNGLTPGAANYSAVLTGTSRNDPSVKDATRDTLSNITRGLVDLTNTPTGNNTSGTTLDGDVGPGPSPQPTTIKTTIAGVAAGFNLYIQNNDNASRAYSLSASASSSFPGNLPPGWTVKFVDGGNNACLAATPGILVTPVISAGMQNVVTACVTPGVQQAPVTAVKIYFQVLATTATTAGQYAVDAKTDAVTVILAPNVAYAASLLGSNTGEVASGGSVTYAHILSNIGTNPCGAYSLNSSFSAADLAAGWTSAIYLDMDGDGKIGVNDKIVTGIISQSLMPGASGNQKIVVQITAPNGLSPGATATATIQAVFSAPNSCGSPSTTDLTTITSGTIRVVKAQALDASCAGSPDNAPSTGNLSVKPGGCIFYHVTAINQGTAPVVSLSIHDSAPAYTSLSPTQPAVKCTSTGTSGVPPTYSNSPVDVACGSAGNIVNPGGTVTLDYTVKVN